MSTMKVERILIGVLVVGMLVPAASAQLTTQQHSHGAATATSGASSAAAAAEPDPANYTRLYVSERYNRLDLKPGQSDSFEVTVENGEDSPVTLDPHLYLPKVGERPVERDWVSIDAGDTTLDAGETRTVEVTVEVPEDVQQAQYQGAVAFTNETITYPGRPARPVHAASFAVEVRREPTVHVRHGDHGFRQARAGGSVTHVVTIENTGDGAVPVNPTLSAERTGRESVIQRSWVDIDAPSEIGPGETANVTVTVEPPGDADRGRYDVPVDLGLKDPARPDHRGYWQRVDVRVQVWKQPDEPIERQFRVSDDAGNVTLTLSTHSRFQSDDGTEPVGFDVEFVSPDGTVVDADRVRVTDSGHVDLSADSRSRYPAASGGEKRFTYRLADPDAGTWSVRIVPHNTFEFGYEITRAEQ